MYKRILIATDGSELSDKAVQNGLSLAALSGASVVALKVVPRYPRSYFEGGMPVEASDIQRIEKQWDEAAQALCPGVPKVGGAEAFREFQHAAQSWGTERRVGVSSATTSRPSASSPGSARSPCRGARTRRRRSPGP